MGRPQAPFGTKSATLELFHIGDPGTPMDRDETPQEKRERYFRHAREAEELALLTRDPTISASFRSIARAWEQLAQQIGGI